MKIHLICEYSTVNSIAKCGENCQLGVSYERLFLTQTYHKVVKYKRVGRLGGVSCLIRPPDDSLEVLCFIAVLFKSLDVQCPSPRSGGSAKVELGPVSHLKYLLRHFAHPIPLQG